jgi:hypothetical protein
MQFPAPKRYAVVSRRPSTRLHLFGACGACALPPPYFCARFCALHLANKELHLRIFSISSRIVYFLYIFYLKALCLKKSTKNMKDNQRPNLKEPSHSLHYSARMRACFRRERLRLSPLVPTAIGRVLVRVRVQLLRSFSVSRCHRFV